MRAKKMSKYLALIVSTFMSLQTQAVDWFSVQDKEVKAANCIRLEAPSKHEMNEYLLAYQNDPDNLVTEKVGPFQFVDESPEFIELFRSLHSYRERSLNLDALQGAKHCRSVLCAMVHNYGSLEAIQMLYIQARFGFPTSPFAALTPENYQKWKSQDLSILIMGLESLPPQLFPIRNHHLLRFLEGYTYSMYGDDGHRVMANATMEFFDLWSQKSKLQKLSILVHEFGHVVGMLYKLDDSREWQELARSQHISEYARENHIEDFAESFTAYRFAPHKLQKRSPLKYNFIRDRVFRGLEFKNNVACEKTFQDFQNQIAQTNHIYRSQIEWAKNNHENVQQELHRIKTIYPFENRAFDKCLNTYLKEVADPTMRESTIDCIKDVFVARAVEVELAEQNKDGQKTSAKRFKDIEASRYYLNNVRLQMRTLTSKAFADAYSQHWFKFANNKTDIENKVNRLNSEDSPLFKMENKPYVTSVFQKAFEFNKRSMLKSLIWEFSPDFEKFLP